MGNNHNDGHNPKLQFLIQPNIGLDKDSRHSIVEILNTILADEAVLTMKTHSIHWHVHGLGFLDLRILFDQQQREIIAISNECAERIRMLGGFAISTFKEILTDTRLEEQPGVVPDILRLLADHEAYIRFLREDVRRVTEEFEDEGTFNLLVSIMRQHEKMAWMLRSHIENEPVHNEKQERIGKDE